MTAVPSRALTPRVLAPVRRVSPVPLAWTATLLAGSLPFVVVSDVLHARPRFWLYLGQLVALLLLLAVARTAPAARSLAGYVVLLIAMDLAFLVAGAIERPRWFDDGPSYLVVPAVAVVNLMPALAMLAVSLVLGRNRRELFLRAGNVHAPSRIPGTRHRVPWSRFGLPVTILFLAPLAVQLALTVHTDVGEVRRAILLLPLGIAFAALNAVQEEFRFRAAPLAWLVPAVGAEQGIWLTAAAFGLAHWNGHPSGPIGVVMTFFAGALLAKCMLETRGLAWPVTIHAAQDLLIFVFLALGAQ
jgi:membrane protease YdiL (CAAX protease family)